MEPNKKIPQEVIWASLDLGDQDVLAYYNEEGELEFVSRTPIKDEEDLRSRSIYTLTGVSN